MSMIVSYIIIRYKCDKTNQNQNSIWTRCPNQNQNSIWPRCPNQNQNSIWPRCPNQNQNSIWPRCPKLLFYGGYSSLHDLHLIISTNNLIQTEQNGKEYQGIRAIEAFE